MGEGRRIADAAALADACPSPVPLPSVGTVDTSKQPAPRQRTGVRCLGVSTAVAGRS
jgi:hypothetical protein